MAKQIYNMSSAEIDAEITKYEKQQAALDARMKSSSTFFSSGVPSKSDLLTDVSSKAAATRLAKLKSNEVARKWYGTTSTAPEDTGGKTRQGVIGKTLDFLSRPLYATVGAAKYATGEGSGSLASSMYKNATVDKDTFGGLLKKKGVNPVVAGVLGFGLDVIADPINLMSGGAVGLSRTAAGKIVKGIAKGAGKEAFKTVGLNAASKLASFIPMMKVDSKIAKVAMEQSGLKAVKEAGLGVTRKGSAKILAENVADKTFQDALHKSFYSSEKGLGKVVGDMRTGIKNLGVKASEASKNYDTLTGFNMGEVLDSRAARDSLAGSIKSMIMQLPGGGKLVEKLEYSSNKWTTNAKLSNLLNDTLALTGVDLEKKFDYGTGKFKTVLLNTPEAKAAALEKVSKVIDEAHIEQKLNMLGTTEKKWGYSNADEVKGAVKKDLDQILEDGINVLGDTGDLRIKDARVAKDALMQELNDVNRYNDLNDLMRKMIGAEELGVADKVRRSIIKNLTANEGKIQYGKKLLDFYDITMGIFKSMKISSLSPSSMVYAILGNGTMQHMSGIDMLRPEVYGRLKDAAVILSAGKVGGAEKYAKLIQRLMSDEKTAMLFNNHSNLTKNSFGLGKETLAIDSAKSVEELSTPAYRKKVADSLKKDWGINQLDADTFSGFKKGSDPTGLLANELAPHKAFINFKEKIAEKAAEGKWGAKKLDWMFKRSRDFEYTDQVWKLENFLLLTQDGISERELLKLTNNFMATTARIGAEDIAGEVVKGEKTFYRIAPEKALEVANEIFMNYAAMPAFVKAVRSMPILGSPFFSFTYAMAAKTGKTLLNNPAAFNQMTFLMKELEGDKSPLERAALKSKFYSYLDGPGMVSLPFFKQNPVYLNMAQMIPYYSLNILNPTTRRFNDDIRGVFGNVLDKSPLFKDPIGQLITDYVLLPAILADDNPQNMFGGKLYPDGTGVLGKLGYAGRSYLESMTPSGIAPLGALVPNKDKNLQYLPNYPMRKFGFATEGKTSVGVLTTEPPLAKSLRAVLGLVGVNLYPVDLANIASEVKKRTE